MSDRDDFLAFCRSQIGKPYILGATGSSAFDCSGFILCGLRELTDKPIPRVSTDQYALGVSVTPESVLPGDLVFFDTGWVERIPNHLGAVTGNGMMINANSVSGVTEEAWNKGYWGKRFTGARRIFSADGRLDLEQSVSLISGFTDVLPSHPHFASIEKLRTQGILQGYADGSFRPDKEISRAEALKIILAAFQIPLASPKTPPFPDVALSDWHAAVVATAKQQKIIGGNDEGNFLPSAPVNRVEIAKIILKTGKAPVKKVKVSRFADIPLAAWYADFAHEAAARGMIEPQGDLFLPSRAVTRGEMCRAIVKLQAIE